MRDRPDIVVVNLALVVAVATTLLLGRLFGDLFPLIEYRQWIQGDLPDFPPSMFSRAFSQQVCLWIWEASGESVPISNWVQLGFVGATAALVALLVRQVLRGAGALPWAMGAGVGFGTSLAALDAAAWQATIHDKMAAMLTAALVLRGWIWARRVPRGTALLRACVELAVLAALAHNTKEAAWCCGPLLLLATLGGHDPGSRALLRVATWRAALRTTWPALAYAVWHVTPRLLSALGQTQDSYSQHVLTGSVTNNLQKLVAALANLGQASTTTGWLLVAAGMAVVATALAVDLRRGRSRVLLGTLAFACALAIPLPSRSASFYYLLTPAVALWWLLAACAGALLPAEGRRAVLLRGGAAAAVLGALLAARSSDAGGLPAYRYKAQCAQNFSTGLSEIARQLEADGDGPRTLHAPRAVYFAYQILGDADNRGLARFLYPDLDPDAWRRIDASIRDVRYEGPPSRPDGDGRHCLLDATLRPIAKPR